MPISFYFIAMALFVAFLAYQLAMQWSVQLLATPLPPLQAPHNLTAHDFTWIALGDLHGDLDKAKEALIELGVTDEMGNWIAGNATLIQLGDMVDRGPDSVGVIDMFEGLRSQARKSGGTVTTLLGNHDWMLISSDYRYVNRGEMKRLGGSKAWGELCGDQGRIGKILRSRPISHLTDTPGCSVLFVHAGVLDWMIDIVDQPHQSLNGSQIVKKWNDIVLDALSRCKGRLDCELTSQQEALLGGQGMIWTRAFTPGSDLVDPSHSPSQGQSRFKSSLKYICDQALKVTERLGVEAIIVGHTVQPKINSLCDGRILMIDVGMSKWVADGAASGLRCSPSKGLEIIGMH